jgi:nickel transport protein
MKQTNGSIWRKMQMTMLPVAALLLLIVPTAHAHRVNVFAWVEGDTVRTESSFPGGREVNGGQVVVYDDETGEKLLAGRTDDKGKFSFPVPRKTSLRIELTAGMGHKNEWIVPAEEILAASGLSGPNPAPSAGERGESADSKAVVEPAGGQEVPSARIEAAVEKVLDRKLAPMVKMMAELRQRRTSLADVVGGIGYIIGLAGLGAYIHYRRKIKELENR